MSEQIATPSAEEQVETPVVQTIVEPETKPELHKITVLHQVKEVPYDELVSLAQQGADYKRVKDQYEDANIEKQFVAKLAKMYGMPVDKFKQEMETSAESMRLGELTGKGIPEDMAKEFLEAREFRASAKEKEIEEASASKRKKDSEVFLQKFPTVTADKIPDSVWKDVADGVPLVHAYASYERDVLNGKLQEYEKAKVLENTNAEIAAASPGSTLGGSPNKPDYYTEERVNSMTTREIADNYDKIMSSRKHWK